MAKNAMKYECMQSTSPIPMHIMSGQWPGLLIGRIHFLTLQHTPNAPNTVCDDSGLESCGNLALRSTPTPLFFLQTTSFNNVHDMIIIYMQNTYMERYFSKNG